MKTGISYDNFCITSIVQYKIVCNSKYNIIVWFNHLSLFVIFAYYLAPKQNYWVANWQKS